MAAGANAAAPDALAIQVNKIRPASLALALRRMILVILSAKILLQAERMRALTSGQAR